MANAGTDSPGTFIYGTDSLFQIICPGSDQIKQVLDYIRRNYASQLSLSDLAKVLQLSPEHFCRVFHSIIGKSPIDLSELLPGRIVPVSFCALLPIVSQKLRILAVSTT